MNQCDESPAKFHVASGAPTTEPELKNIAIPVRGLLRRRVFTFEREILSKAAPRGLNARPEEKSCVKSNETLCLLI
jgi:hypothetical protein